MENPLTIAIPVYNRSEFFPEALASALKQTIATPIIVVDNASTRFDFAKAVRDCGDPRVSYYRNPTNLGMVENWNQCLRLPGTRWVSILHDDDLLYPHAVEWLAKAIEECPGAGLYFGLDDAMDEASRVTRNKVESDPPFEQVDPREYVIRNQFCACGFAIDRENALTLGGYDQRRQMTSDWDLYSRISVRHGALRIKRVIGAYREPIFRESGTAALAVRGILLPSLALQRARNIRDYANHLHQTLPLSHRTEQAELAHRLLAQIGFKMTRRGFRSARLYACLAPPGNRWKALAFRLSPGLFARLLVWYSFFTHLKSSRPAHPPAASKPQ